jgi:NAD(P)-dependent dehydrogenase (short-subunit alcohol dehydrogenase family)
VHLSLADRTVLVTGGGSGIGKGVAAAVVAAGGDAMIVGRNADKLAGATAAIKERAGQGAGSVRYEPADITDEDEVARVVDAATAWTGRLHGVMHCAGGSETIGPITQVDSEAWRRTVDLNVNGRGQ